MKKFLPFAIVVLGFTGFLSMQIAWDIFHTNAQQIDQDKGQYQLLENLFQELKLPTTKGQSVELKSLKTPLVVINFWASWCLPCLKEFPSLIGFEKKFADQVTIIGINGDEENPEKEIEKVSTKFGLDFIQVPDPGSEISDRFKVNAYPYTVIYHAGKVLHVSQKMQDFLSDEFLKKIEGALKERRPTSFYPTSK